jgi:hypothetical protein
MAGWPAAPASRSDQGLDPQEWVSVIERDVMADGQSRSTVLDPRNQIGVCEKHGRTGIRECVLQFLSHQAKLSRTAIALIRVIAKYAIQYSVQL